MVGSCSGRGGERRQAVRRVGVLDSRIESEEARRIHDRTGAEEFEVELVLVLAAALEDKIAKESQWRFVAW